MGGLAVTVIFYGSIIFCVFATIVKIVKYINAPLHLHWEIYSGSSVYETSDWWTKPPKSFLHKLKSAVLDILLLKEYYVRNRSYYFFLYLFHLGLYLLVVWHVWLFVSAAVFDFKSEPEWALIWGHVSTLFVFIGTVGILVMRMIDKDLKIYYPPIHYAKWVVMLLSIGSGFYAVQYYFGGNMANVLMYVKHQLAFELESKLQAPVPTSAHLLLVVPWVIYFAFGHIMRIFFRYFHELRWDGEQNLKGSPVEKRIKSYLERPVSWSAPHIQSGKKWREVVAALPLDPPEKGPGQ